MRRKTWAWVLTAMLATAIAAVTIIATPALAADVGVSISIGQPGFYGRLDIGGYPPPRVLYREPIAIRRVPVARPPIYLRVPPGHARNWSRHCRTYNACGERVYFVQDRWYNNEYVPRYQRYQRDRQHQVTGPHDRRAIAKLAGDIHFNRQTRQALDQVFSK